jgi:transposase
VSTNFLVDTMQGKVKVVRRRRRHSEEFRERVVSACRAPGVSVAAVALANGLNANLLRRWIKERAQRMPVSASRAIAPVPRPMTVVPVSIAPTEERGGEEIRIDIRRAGIAAQLAWPATRTAELSVLLKELLK